jgi:hypothetical protein
MPAPEKPSKKQIQNIFKTTDFISYFSLMN